jgi:hypothetical protein
MFKKLALMLKTSRRAGGWTFCAGSTVGKPNPSRLVLQSSVISA